MSEQDEQRLPSLEQYPDPAVSYELDDGEPAVVSTNEAFEAAFGPLTAGSPLREFFESDEMVSETDSEEKHFETGGQFVLRADDGEGFPTRYRTRVVPPTEETVGYVVCIDESDDGLEVDHVASVISHDLRNPLDVAEARLRAGRETDAEDHFDHVEQAHERMERIIEDVLTLARGEEVVEPEGTAEFDHLAERAWQTVETNGATLELEESLPTATADRGRVGRLFENIFRNAVEHGGRDATIRVGRLEDGVYVADDGPGIAPDLRETVFQPGYSTDEHGTGLGLAIVDRIADLHGWSVEVAESEDGGARFEIRGLEVSD